MTNSELAKAIRFRLYADRDTIQDAYKYVVDVANSSENPTAVLTAVHMMMNTIANYIDQVDELETVTNG
jgi:hypothetical protein